MRSVASFPRASLLVLLLLLFPHRTHAEDWTYRVRPHDNLWDLSRQFLKPDVRWEQLQAYNRVTDPLHLPPGEELHVPIAWLRIEPARAEVVAVLGDARVRMPNASAEVPVVAGMKLRYGAHLETSAGASLTLRFADGSRVLLQQDSALDLDRMSAYGKTGMVDTRLRLQHGRINSDVTHLIGTGAHFSVSTPEAISSVRGTHFRVIADAASHRSQTEVTGGRVAVTGEHRQVLVPSGSGVSVAHGSGPAAVSRLLDAPSLQCPAGTVRQLPVTLHWSALGATSHYRVQVASDARFSTLLTDRIVDATRIAVDSLSDGEHAVRVRGIDGNKLEGMDGTCMITVAAHPLPPLVLAPQDGSLVHEDRPVFRWTQSEEAVAYVWQLADEPTFAQPLAEKETRGDHVRSPRQLPLGRHFWRIASRDRQGRLGPYGQPIAFDRVAEPAQPAFGQAQKHGKQLQMSWQAGKPGQHYRVQLARHDDFSHPLLDRTVDAPNLSIAKPGNGTWYVRVRIIDRDGYAGAWGPSQKLKLGCTACRVALGVGGAVVLYLLL